MFSLSTTGRMTMRTQSRWLSALLVVAACSAPPAAPPGLTDADRDAIRAMTAAFVTGINAKDWTAATANYAEDVLWLPPNGPEISGKSAVQSWMAAFPPFANFAASSVEIEGVGDLAYSRGTYEIDVTPPGAAAAMHDKGKYIEIYRKQADGSWKLVRDIFNSDLPVTLPAPASPAK